MPGYKELKELQKDAQRVIKQTERLKEMNPLRSGSYTEQLIATLAVINKQAEKTAAKSEKGFLTTK